jgi:nuclear transport factor 2 (NTF2) superfamily protein
MPDDRPPLPPFTRETATQKVHGNELWEFDEHGPMKRREASIDDVRVDESERRIFGPRPVHEHGRELPLR